MKIMHTRLMDFLRKGKFIKEDFPINCLEIFILSITCFFSVEIPFLTILLSREKIKKISVCIGPFN